MLNDDGSDTAVAEFLVDIVASPTGHIHREIASPEQYQAIECEWMQLTLPGLPDHAEND